MSRISSGTDPASLSIALTVALIGTLVFCGVPASATEAAAAAAAIPNLSGNWQRLQGKFDAPDSGPGPVMNTAARGTARNWPDYANPVLQPWVSEIVKRNHDSEKAGVQVPTASSNCWPGSVPGVLGMNSMLQLHQLHDRVMLLYVNNHQFRTVYLNQGHSPYVKPSWYGESVGHYEGHALVVDTIGMMAHPMSLLDQYATPHTEAIHVIERYFLMNNGTQLRTEVYVEDQGAFTTPFVAIADHNRTDREFEENVCAENNENHPGLEGTIPTAQNADF